MNKIVCLPAACLLALLWSGPLYSQIPTHDDTVEVAAPLQKARIICSEDPDSSLIFAKEALLLSQKKHFQLGVFSSYQAMGHAFKAKADFRNALYYYHLAYKVAMEERLEKAIIASRSDMVHVYERMGDYDNALVLVQQNVQKTREMNDLKGLAQAYTLMAECLSSKGDNQLAIGYFEKAIELNKQLGNPRVLIHSLNSASVVYTNLKKYKEALSALKTCTELFDETSFPSYSVSVYLNYGYCYDDMNRPDSAEYYYVKALDLLKDSKDSDRMIILDNLGQLYLNQKKYGLAEKHLLEALELARSVNSLTDLKYIHGNLSELYYRTGDFEKALLHKQEFVAASDSLMNLEKMKAIEELSIKFETKETVEKNKLLQKENDLQKTKIEQRNYLVFTILMFALLLVTIIFLYMRQKRFRVEKENLDIQQKLLRIQMNPHFIFNSLNAIQNYIISKNNLQAGIYLSQFAELIRMILEFSRKDRITLEAELKFLQSYMELQQMRFENYFKYTLHIDEDIAPDMVLVPPMLAQPFLENAIEHGGFNREREGFIRLSIYRKKELILFEIEDSGIGLEASMKLKDKISKHESLATKITLGRLETLYKSAKKEHHVEITDKKLLDPEQSGVRVTFAIPYMEK